MKNKILIIDDEPALRLMIRAVLQDSGFEVQEASNGQAGLEILSQAEIHAVLLDIRMPKMDGMQVLQHIKQISPDLPVVMLTAFGSVGSAVEAMKAGAFDYLSKPCDNDELLEVVQKAVQFSQSLKLDNNQSLGLQSNSNIIGQSPAMSQVLELIEQVAPTEANVLILGHSGTGKELVAKAVHDKSRRSSSPLIKVNCAALPENLLESELFGYVRGAFTGAVKDKPGRFKLADKGSLFLDEIGEMPINLQAKLLRVLQEREVEPLGALRSQKIDVRIIAATNRDLQKEVENGNFREDLYYRLNVLEIKIPPLQQRQGDIELLAPFLLHKLGQKNHKQIRGVSKEAMQALQTYSWPGNVRELENVLERALILCRADTIGLQDLPKQLRENKDALSLTSSKETQLNPLEKAERQAILKALQQHGGHRQKTAEALDMSRRSLQYKLKKYDLIKK